MNYEFDYVSAAFFPNEVQAAHRDYVPIFLLPESEKNRCSIDDDEVSQLCQQSKLIVSDERGGGGRWIALSEIPKAEEYGMVIIDSMGVIFVRVGSPWDE